MKSRRVFTKEELDQIEKSAELIMQEIRRTGQDLGVMLDVLRKANSRLEENILTGKPLTNKKKDI